VRIALDDFGTGFSSLSYLRSFPFDKIKIDRCFIEGLGEGNEESLAIVRAVSRVGASLGIATAAEGVETRRKPTSSAAKASPRSRAIGWPRQSRRRPLPTTSTRSQNSASVRRTERRLVAAMPTSGKRVRAGSAAPSRRDLTEFYGVSSRAGPVSMAGPFSAPHSAQLPS
jgi:predicted signal transduction protein with EAL and GGDEF domain